MTELQAIAKATILRTVTGTNEVPEDALIANSYGWTLINNGTCTEAEWRDAVDEAIGELLDEGVMRSTLIDAGTPARGIDGRMLRFIPAIVRVEAPAPVVEVPAKADAIELDEERIETLLVLTQDDETHSPLELMIQTKYGQDSTRHGAYEIVLEYSKKLKAISKWTKDTPAWIKKELMINFDSLEEATQMISEYYEAIV